MKKRIRWNYKLVKQFVELNGYKLVSKEYKKTRDKLTFICPKGHQFEMTFSNFKNNISCPICNGTMLTYDIVKQNIEKEGYKLLSSEYKNNRSKLKIECSKGHQFEMQYTNFQQGQRCPICAKEKNLQRIQSQKLKYEYVKEYIEANGDKLLSTEYINARENLKIKCSKGHIYYMKWYNYKTGYRCPICGVNSSKEKQKYDLQHIKEYIKNQGEELLSKEYINSKTKLKVKCSKGHIYFVTFDNYKQGNRCPVCKESKGEKEIKRILDNNNINYVAQYKFDDCKFKRKLPFDFYLPDYNLLIEYDGEQHYKIKKHFGGYEGFVNTKIRDTIKNIYCEQNNIKLIRISYWDYKNINKILNKELKIS